MKNNPFAPFWSPLWHHKSPKGYSDKEFENKLQSNDDCENV